MYGSLFSISGEKKTTGVKCISMCEMQSFEQQKFQVYRFVFTSNTNKSLSLPGVWDGTLISKGMFKLQLLKFFDFSPLDARCLHPQQQ